MNVIFISLDTLRADHLSCYGYPRKTSPNIDMLASDGVLFENNITGACHTTPSYTSMLTGQDPFTHGVIATLHAVRNELYQRLDDTVPTLPEILYVGGWRTYAVDNLFHFICFPSWFARGYRYYINVNPPGRQAHVIADEINEEALRLLERVDWERDNFIFLHYWDPHRPYNQPDNFRGIFPRDLSDLPVIDAPDGTRWVLGAGPLEELDDYNREQVCLYDEEIYYCDTRVGQVLEELRRLGVYDEALIILNADHGEDMREHHAWYEHREPYEHTCRVPLIIKFPKSMGIEGGRRVSAITTHSDLLPTILEVVGVKWREGISWGREGDGWTLQVDGQSLVPLARGEREKIRDYIIVTGCYLRDGKLHKSCEVAVRTEGLKLIVRSAIPPGQYEFTDVAGLMVDRRGRTWQVFNELPRVELLNFREDPTETHNLIAEMPEEAEELAELLDPVFASELWYSGHWGRNPA